MKYRVYLLSFVLAFVLALPKEVRADMYSFHNISGNNSIDAAIGEAQLFFEVTDGDDGQALFTFSNTGPDASSITQIYFDDGVLDSIVKIDDSVSGVLFSENARPRNLPGWRTVSPVFDEDFSVGSDSPVQPNGVNPDETLGLWFSLQGSPPFDDVIKNLNTGALRVGIHVQGFESGGSESFVNTPNPIPALGAVLLGMIGLSVVGVKLRKQA